MTSQKYHLLWKGVESGPYSAADIQRMLKFGEIGYFHKIKMEGMSDYVLLKDFNFSTEITYNSFLITDIPHILFLILSVYNIPHFLTMF